jgi:hypothetical protein
MLKLPRLSAEITTIAIRCWRLARDAGAPVQRRLYAALVQFEAGVLAPVFDSLLAACEAALGRRIEAGTTIERSDDERLVLAMLDGSQASRGGVGCDAGTASVLDGAIRSTRIMLSLATASG